MDAEEKITLTPGTRAFAPISGVTVAPVYDIHPRVERTDSVNELLANKTWESCCFRVDRACVMFIVQTLIGSGLLTFCAYRLSTEADCDRASPYWGLIGTLCGFFFNKMSMSKKRGERV